ncbi:MAG TPA: hypothetical protein VLA34_03680, partial [Candidatus Krumholzibacterium sp.]|nr:hypothetical protein [Candidatus Krumholzibacterium sp.]
MKTVSGCLRSGVLALVIMLAVPLAAWSYHFELVSIDGSVQEAPVFIGTGITSDFVYGPVISSEIDAYGERTASTDLLFNGNTCTFIAMTDVMTDATATLLQSYAAVSASFYVRVVADPGDPATVGIVAEWSSTTHSEYYDT